MQADLRSVRGAAAAGAAAAGAAATTTTFSSPPLPTPALAFAHRPSRCTAYTSTAVSTFTPDGA